jgi:hypothetical protein
MTASTPRSELSALAARNNLSKHSLTLIKDATLPNLARGQRLTDAQIGIVHEAVEVCLLSGLTDEQLPQAIEEHRDRAPHDWEASFWRERLALANENANRQQAGEQRSAAAEPLPLVADRPPVAPIEPEPPQPRPARHAPVPPIPPQPPSEVRSGARDTHSPLAA